MTLPGRGRDYAGLTHKLIDDYILGNNGLSINTVAETLAEYNNAQAGVINSVRANETILAKAAKAKDLVLIDMLLSLQVDPNNSGDANKSILDILVKSDDYNIADLCYIMTPTNVNEDGSIIVQDRVLGNNIFQYMHEILTG